MKAIPFYLLATLLILTSSCSSDDDAISTSGTTTEDGPEEVAPLVTLIPDATFEAFLISINVDDVLDGTVVTENLATVTQIVVNNLAISDLTGIEDCPNLFNLWLQNCNVSQLDVSNNLQLQFIYFDNNNISSINVSMLPLLEKLSARDNMLTSVNVSNNPELELLEVSDNAITGITVATNTVLNRLDVANNPLTCIEVNENQLSATTLDWTLDADDILSLDCN